MAISPEIFIVCLITSGIIANRIDAVSNEIGSSLLGRKIWDVDSDISDCAAANLKVEEIYEGDQEIEFIWDGKPDTPDTRYEVKCYLTEDVFDFYTSYQCTYSDISRLSKRKYKWSYDFEDTNFYCAVEESTSFSLKRSNIVEVRSPSHSYRTKIIGGSVAGFVFICLVMVVIIIYYKRRQFGSAGIIVSNPPTTSVIVAPAPSLGAQPHQQQPPVYPPGTTQFPHSQPYRPWDAPPPYTLESKDTEPLIPSAPELSAM